MNEYIKTDIEQGKSYLKVGVMNTLAGIESGEINDIKLDSVISLSIIIECAEERGWKEEPDMNPDWTNGWQIDYWYVMITPNGKYIDISGSVLDSNNIELRVNYNYE